MGYAGTGFSRAVARHGGFSPYEVHIALLATRPSFKKSFESELPTSNVDITPAILHIHQSTILKTVDGRIMNELLSEAVKLPKMEVKKETISKSANYLGGIYKLNVERTIFGNTGM